MPSKVVSITLRLNAISSHEAVSTPQSDGLCAPDGSFSRSTTPQCGAQILAKFFWLVVLCCTRGRLPQTSLGSQLRPLNSVLQKRRCRMRSTFLLSCVSPFTSGIRQADPTHRLPSNQLHVQSRLIHRRKTRLLLDRGYHPSLFAQHMIVHNKPIEWLLTSRFGTITRHWLRLEKFGRPFATT